MTRLLITGASGLLGLNLALDAAGTHEVIGVDRNTLKSAPFQVIKADLLSRDAVPNILKEANPEAVIHCAALADVDTCESNPDLARRTNTELPAQLADECARRNIRLIHISTDAVFNGQKAGHYSESDQPTPDGVYATTKFQGEKAVLQANPAAIVARVNFYGWSLGGKRSLAEFFVNNLSNGRTVNGFTDVTFCPMLVNHLGKILIQMLDIRPARAISRGWAASDEQISVRRGDRTQIRPARKPDISAIGGQIEPNCTPFPQFMAFHPQVVNRFASSYARLFHRSRPVLCTVPAGLSTENPQLST